MKLHPQNGWFSSTNGHTSSIVRVQGPPFLTSSYIFFGEQLWTELWNWRHSFWSNITDHSALWSNLEHLMARRPTSFRWMRALQRLRSSPLRQATSGPSIHRTCPSRWNKIRMPSPMVATRLGIGWEEKMKRRWKTPITTYHNLSHLSHFFPPCW